MEMKSRRLTTAYKLKGPWTPCKLQKVEPKGEHNEFLFFEFETKKRNFVLRLGAEEIEILRTWIG